MLWRVFLALVIVNAGLLAQQPAVDPILGTWKLNLMQSKVPAVVSALEQHIKVYRDAVRQGCESQGESYEPLLVYDRQE
jgi:hypothetical protein